MNTSGHMKNTTYPNMINDPIFTCDMSLLTDIYFWPQFEASVTLKTFCVSLKHHIVNAKNAQ